MKFADGKTSSANVPHLNVWGFDISAAEFPQPKKTRVFGVNRPLRVLSINLERNTLSLDFRLKFNQNHLNKKLIKQKARK